MTAIVKPQTLTTLPTADDVEAAKASFISGKGFDVWHHPHDETSTLGEFTQLTIKTVLGTSPGLTPLNLMLKGNHMEQFRGLADRGADACLRYYRDNIAEKHHLSERLVERHFPCLIEGAA